MRRATLPRAGCESLPDVEIRVRSVTFRDDERNAATLADLFDDEDGREVERLQAIRSFKRFFVRTELRIHGEVVRVTLVVNLRSRLITFSTPGSATFTPGRVMWILYALFVRQAAKEAGHYFRVVRLGGRSSALAVPDPLHWAGILHDVGQWGPVSIPIEWTEASRVGPDQVLG